MLQSYITNPPKWCDNVAEVYKFSYPAHVSEARAGAMTIPPLRGSV